MVAPSSVGLAVPGLTMILIQVLKQTGEVIKMYRDAKETVHEKSVIFQDHILKLQLEVEEFNNLSPDLPEDLSAHLAEMLQTLLLKLLAVEAELATLLKKEVTLQISVVVSCIGRVTEDVDSWHRRIMDWFEQLARFPKPFADPRLPDPRTALGRVRLANQAIFAATESTPSELDLKNGEIPQELIQLQASPVYVPPTAEHVIVEIKRFDPKTPPEEVEKMKKDVMDLARILSAEDIASRGILNCKGYRHETKQHHFKLIFNTPKNLEKPRSLRDILTDREFKDQTRHPLNERISLAKQLTRAVLHVHSKNHVHKNIRPDTILLFEVLDTEGDASQPSQGNSKAFPVSLGQAFLTGFERVRKDEADTVPMTEATWAEDIYRHPSRQGSTQSEDKFSMLHDVYSLGVCLLEIAMWRSFVMTEMRDGSLMSVNNRRACDLMEPGLPSGMTRFRSPQKIQEKFIRDAKNRIPVALGQRFSQAVVRCLECVERFEDEADTNTTLLGVKYVLTVLSDLEEITV